MKEKNFEQDRHYDDLEGNVRTFTIRDYSKKTKVFLDEKIDYNAILSENRERVIKEILSLHPQVALPEWSMYVTKNIKAERFEWDEKALRDAGLSLEILIMHKNVMSNRQKLIKK